MRINTNRLSVSMVGLALLVGVLACAERPAPVGGLALGNSSLTLGYPQALEVELNWQMESPLEGLSGEPLVFLHLLDANGDLVRTFDHDFPGPWQVGGEQSYSVSLYQSALAPPLDEGPYTLTAGIYDHTGNRWALETEGPEVAENEYQVATVDAVASVPGTPQFFFSASWLPVEGGTDLQILSRRWLPEDGVIRVGGLTEPGELWLLVGIPEGGGALQEPVLEEGAVDQSVEVTTTCGGASVRLSGPGSHPASLPIAIPEAVEGEDADKPADCEVRFDSNYYLMSHEGDQSRTVVLEVLSWDGS